MRIATWNLERPRRNGHTKNRACLSKLQEIDADLWFLTETNAAIALPGYSTHASPPLKGYHAAGENFTTVVSRWPIIRPIATWDPLLTACAEIESPFGPLLAYGTIITYANDTGSSKSSPRWHEHRVSIKRHREDWVALRRKFPSHGLVVAGDFNQSRDGSGWYEDPQSVVALTEALHASDLKCATQDNLRQTLGLSRATVDHICFTSPIADMQYTVGAWEGNAGRPRMSDHNGVYVEIRT